MPYLQVKIFIKNKKSLFSCENKHKAIPKVLCKQGIALLNKQADLISNKNVMPTGKKFCAEMSLEQ